MTTSASQTRFILVNTSHAGNVGAAARALKVMGFDAPGQLVLMQPRYDNVLRKQEAIALASGALDVLESARLVLTPSPLAGEQCLTPSPLTGEGRGEGALCNEHKLVNALTPHPNPLPQGERGQHEPLPQGEREQMAAWHESLGDATFTVALTARGRDFGPPAFELRELCEKLAAQPAQKVAFVFGSERFGLPNELVYKCHAIAHIPANPNYSSLNLAQSLMLVSYEWSQALRASKAANVSTPDAPPVEAPASQAAIEAALEHWQQVLIDLEFLDPDAPKKLMPRLQRLMNRAQLTEQEIHILRGIAKAASKK